MGSWDSLPAPLLLTVFGYLPPHQVLSAGLTCAHWLAASRDGPLWRRLFCRTFRRPFPSTQLLPGARSWLQEFRRLTHLCPKVLSEELKGHSDEVLHVSFSHSGKEFVTCSKDGRLLVWSLSLSNTAALRHSEDMKGRGWLFTWASRYNSADSLLLVAGVVTSVDGEIAIFNTADYSIVCRVPNNPYDVMGAWCDETSWLSGGIFDTFPEGGLTTVHICRTQPGEVHEGLSEEGEEERGISVYRNIALRVRSDRDDGSNYLRCLLLSDRAALPPAQDATSPFGSYEEFLKAPNLSTLQPQEADPCCSSLLSSTELCLIFLCSRDTSVPHMLGFKRLYPQDLSSVPVVSSPDRTLELQGHIVGLALSRDSRYLHCNLRRWPKGAVPSDQEPPPIAQEIEMVVVDLVSLTLLPTVYTGHKGYTDSQGAFYIYLDVGSLLVASGSEDGRATVWDRHYGCPVSSLQHSECVNCVAFSPSNEELAVTVSDDHTVKIWKSVHLHKRDRKQQLQVVLTELNACEKEVQEKVEMEVKMQVQMLEPEMPVQEQLLQEGVLEEEAAAKQA